MNLAYKIRNLPKFLQDYFRYQRYICFMSETTCQEMIYDINTFLSFAKTKFEISPKIIDSSFINTLFLSFEDINLEYINFLKNTLKNSPDTIARKIYSLKKLLSYLYERNELDKNFAVFLEYIKPKHKKQTKYLTLKETKKYLFVSSKSSSNKDLNTRNYCICNLFLNLGLRVGEISKIKLDDISIENRTILIHGKGDRDRILYLNKSAINSIKNYLKVRPVLNSNNYYYKYLFISKRNIKLSKRQIQNITKNIFFKIDKPNFSCHKLRSTFVNILYNNICLLKEKPNILEFSTILGHSSLNTIDRYLSFNKLDLKEKIMNFDILSLSRKE